MNHYETSNFYLSVYMMAHGYEPEVSYKGNSYEATFVFHRLKEDAAKTLIQEFYQDEILQSYIPAIKKLKELLYSNKPPELY